MMYVDYKFEITPQGLVMLDKPDPDEKYMIQLKNTPFEVGDKFGQHICGYYKKVMLSKKRMYEEIGILLMQIPNLSVCLQMKERKSAFPSANEDELSPRKIAIDLP